MSTRAQLSQERSRHRRDILLEAAIELFAEGGSRAITHRAVAARAGLPPATTTYYFASIDDLIRAALASHLGQWRSVMEHLASLEAGSEVSIDNAERFISLVYAMRTPAVAALELSIYLAATQDDHLREAATDALRSLESLAAQMLARLGVTDAPQIAAAIVALVAGAAVRRQSDQYDDAAEAMMLSSAIRLLIGAHLLGADAIDSALEPLRGIAR